ncbi:MAG: acyl-CoA dehydratase activase [Armatimonadetes bacterium]|nr:acyl-CoA dehydratase activase [Armatimonadota bacterium]
MVKAIRNSCRVIYRTEFAVSGEDEMIGVGIDAGSRAIKIVLMEPMSLRVLGSGVMRQGVNSRELAEELLEQVLAENSLERVDVSFIVATGYARGTVSAADTTVTEITCHACGVHHLMPEVRTVVEIGGQDSKLLSLYPSGAVRDFVMNDRCAAGTGRFLEVVADRLGVTLEDLGRMSQMSRLPAPISSTCIVFAETEIIGLLSSGVSPEDIVAGVQNSIATRVAAMAGRSMVPPVAFTGGVALVPGMARALEAAIGEKVSVVPNPQMTGALGAAILACRQVCGLECAKETSRLPQGSYSDQPDSRDH